MVDRKRMNPVAARGISGLLGLVTLVGVPLACAAQEAESPDLSDPEVAHVAVTANAIDVELAELARDKAQSPDVQAFARTMISDHTAVNERAAELAGRLGVVPAENDVSRSLQEGAGEARERLESIAGAAFDRAYMEREVAYHAAVLSALDDLLIPTTENAELRALLQEVRPAIAAHLEHARGLSGKLES